MTTLRLPLLTGAKRSAVVRQAPRGYWRTVGRRLRYDYVTLFFALVIVHDRAGRDLRAAGRAASIRTRPAWSIGLKPIGYKQFMPRHRRARPRHALAPDLWRAHLADDGSGSGRARDLHRRLPRRARRLHRRLDQHADHAHRSTCSMRFPSVLLAVAISGTMGGGVANGLIALTLVFIPPLCRVSEAATTQIRSRDFVEAARASGASNLSIIFYHVLRNVLAPGADLRVEPDLGRRSCSPPGCRFSAGASSRRRRLGLDALDAAAVDLRPAADLRVAGRGDLHRSLSFNLVSDGLRQAMDIRA